MTSAYRLQYDLVLLEFDKINSMFLDAFHTQKNQSIHVNAEQGSRFAKKVAGDFNPLHDEDSKRFIVPGDLLFALTLSKLGVAKRMNLTFTGMVGKESLLTFPAELSPQMAITDQHDKECLTIQSQGDVTTQASLIENFINAYVAFSGESFPHILVPLMQAHNKMVNPARPMVMYENMGFEFEHLNASEISLELASSKLEANGKRGKVTMEFTIKSQGDVIGKGHKNMMLSGLRDYDDTAMNALVNDYEQRKANYTT